MPSHRAAESLGPSTVTEATSGTTSTLAPLATWEDRLREASGWAASVATLPPLTDLPAGTPGTSRGGSVGPSLWSGELAVVDAPSRAPRVPPRGTPQVVAPAGRTRYVEPVEVPGASGPSASGPVASGPVPAQGRHSTGPVALPAVVPTTSQPAFQPTFQPSFHTTSRPAAREDEPRRAEPERVFAPVRGRRALPDPITDPDLLRSAVPLPPFSDTASSRRLEASRAAEQEERSAGRPSGRRRSHAATDALPAIPPAREHPPVPGAGTAIPPQTRRGRRAAAAARPAGRVGDDDGHAGTPGVLPGGPFAALMADAGSSFQAGTPQAATPQAGTPQNRALTQLDDGSGDIGDTFWTTAGLTARSWEPAPSPAGSGLLDDGALGGDALGDAPGTDALGGTELLDLPAWWATELDDAQPGRGTGVLSHLPSPRVSEDGVPTTVERPRGEAAEPITAEPTTTERTDAEVAAFVPARGRSAHRRTPRKTSFVPQAGIVGALGLATVLAPVAAAHMPFLASADAASALPGVDASRLPSPVATAAHALLGNRLATVAPDDLAGRDRRTVSRSTRTADATSAAPAGTAAAAAGVTDPSSSPVTASGSTSASGSSTSASAQASLAAPPSTVAAAQTSIPGITASATSGVTPSATPTATLSPQQQAVNALVPGCSGATPDTKDAVNGRLPSDDLCQLWQSGEALRSDAAVAFAQLDVAYKAQFGEDIQLSASYRPYAEQVRLKQVTPRLAAVPGTSEHGWGLAADLGGGVQNSDEHYDWLMANAPKYGWAHPAWAQRGGGGPYEPWHWEYVAGED